MPKISILFLSLFLFCTMQAPVLAKRQKVTHIHAVITKVLLLSEWEHYANGAFRSFDSITFRVIGPSVLKGGKLTVRIPSTLYRKRTAIRKKGTRCHFSIRTSFLRKSSKIKLYWGALRRFKVMKRTKK